MQAAETLLQEEVKGPKLLRLSDGRWVAIATVLCPWLKERKVTLFIVEPDAALFRLFVHVDGTSYAGLAEHDGRLWVTCLDGDCYGKTRAEFNVALAEVPVPDSCLPPQDVRGEDDRSLETKDDDGKNTNR